MISSSSPPPFAVLLLAGGRSRRMGRDKAGLLWQGRPLWRHQLERLAALGAGRCLVACREEQGLQGEASLPGWEWLFDPVGDEQGPLGAIARALRVVQMPLVVLAVDMPFMTAAFLREELGARVSAGRGRFFATAQGVEPMAACYVPEMLPVMERRLAKGERGLQRLIEACVTLDLAEVRELRDEDRPLFANLNTPGEWEDCQLPNTA
jgi:molybdopterin-guanine dinucleotide biosynthesis protein A